MPDCELLINIPLWTRTLEIIPERRLKNNNNYNTKNKTKKDLKKFKLCALKHCFVVFPDTHSHSLSNSLYISTALCPCYFPQLYTTCCHIFTVFHPCLSLQVCLAFFSLSFLYRSVPYFPLFALLLVGSDCTSRGSSPISLAGQPKCFALEMWGKFKIVFNYPAFCWWISPYTCSDL